METKRFLTTAGILTAGLLAAGCGKKNAANNPMMAGGTPEVSVITIQPQPVELSTELSGRVAASMVAEVRPQVSGIILERLFTEGANVHQGDVLYRIDPASYQAAYEGAKAALAKAEANLEPVRLRAERYAGLMKSDAVSSQDYDEAAAALKLTQAEIESAKAAVEAARINLEYTKVTAPISGRIGRSSVTTGALVTANQPMALATIQQLDPVYVDVTRSSAEILRLRRALESGVLTRGQKQAKVNLILDDGSHYAVPGTLKFSEAFVDESTSSVTLRTLFSNPDSLLLPGMFVRAILEEGVKEKGILVPQRGVTRNPAGKAMVMVVGAEDTVEPRLIETDRTVGDNWLVNGGLNPGDRVILEGIQKARPGTKVKALPFTAPTTVPAAPKN